MILNIHKPNFVTLFIYFLTWILCVIGFSSYWWTITINDNDSSDPTKTKVELKHDQQKVTITTQGQTIKGTTSLNSEQMKYELIVLRVCLAFCVLSFIVVSGCISLIVLHLFNILKQIPFPSKLFAKILPFIGVFFCFVSMFAFISYPAAIKKDCENNSDGSNYICLEDITKKFIGSYTISNSELSWGPTTSWASMVIASAFMLGAASFNLVFGNYGEITAH